MNQKSDIFISKWYADVIDNETKNLCIIYSGNFKWKIIDINFFNSIEFKNRSKLVSFSKFGDNTVFELGRNELQASNDNFKGIWRFSHTAIQEIIFNSQDGYIFWECHVPSSMGCIVLNNQTYSGLGYAEKLTVTVMPWNIPIKILRWGRFVSESNYVIWISWRGPQNNFDNIYHNGAKYVNAHIDDEKLVFDNYTLEFSEKHSIRDGKLKQTIFKPFSWLKNLLPSTFLNIKEVKWQSKGILYQDQTEIDKSWCIHEKVEWNSNFMEKFGKFMYVALFVLIIPSALLIWANRIENLVDLPLINYFFVNLFVILSGFFIMVFSLLYLYKKGEGIPMNAYPPPKFVNSGPYKVISHPIYVGASIFCLGISLFFQSKSGVWVITPVFTFAWLSLVYGFENYDLLRRFPKTKTKFLLDLPEDLMKNITLENIFQMYALLLVPWVAIYKMIIFIGVSKYPISTYLRFEKYIPVIEEAEILYSLAYPFVALAPLSISKQCHARSYIIQGLIISFIGFYFQLIFPFVAFPRPFKPRSFLGILLEFERLDDGPNAAFPSFHVALSFLSAKYYSIRFRKFSWFFYLLALLISASCILTGMHSLVDIVAGFILSAFAFSWETIWRLARANFEKLANSWSYLKFGPLRILNYSIFSFISGLLLVLLLSLLLENLNATLIISFLALIGSCLWGQLVEASSKLSRPFGYFGAIIGGLLGCFFCNYIWDLSILKMSVCSCLLAPWIQCIGRFRCVVQGCCHGSVTTRFIGIIVTNEKSRTCSISKLKDKPVHLTQLYSIIGNIIIGSFLWKLWYSEAEPIFIPGFYLILTGYARFIEEAFRAEAQTPVWFKLKIYQWLSILFVVFGIGLTFLPYEQVNISVKWDWFNVLPAALFGIILSFATAMDFPDSNKPSSRLCD